MPATTNNGTGELMKSQYHNHPSVPFSIMSFEDDVAFLAQQEAIFGSLESSQKRQRTDEHEDEQALLRLALQESKESHQRYQANQQSEKLAQQLHLQEMKEADEELASALNKTGLVAQEEYEYAALTEAKVRQSQERHAGSWDCLACTLTNDPFEPSCKACGCRAPDHVLVFEPIPGIRFGVEIEIIVQDGKRDGFTLESIAQSLNQLGEPIVQFAGYTHQTTRHWKIVTDASIRGEEHDLCLELVSPVLSGTDGMSELRSILDHVRRLGIATNASCGFHVHVDATPGGCLDSVRALRRVAQCFVALENAFDLIVGLSWDANNTGSGRRANSNQYCRSNRLSFGGKSNAQRWKSLEDVRSRGDLVALMNPNQDRYRKLNLTNLTKHNRDSTCEFRQHGGVQDIWEAEAWVRMILSFCHNAATTDRYATCLLPERATVEDEIRALFYLVGCQGLEQFFVVERRLFNRNQLQNQWTCATCHRVFDSSRSLSQHTAATGH